jgi:hypothetical protein
VKKYSKFLMCIIFTVFLLAGMISSANALPLGPGDAILDENDINPLDPSYSENPNADDIASYFGYSNGYSYYKSEVDGGAESGNFASSYTTTYDPPSDPEDATISWDGLPKPHISAADPLWLVVKDGAAHDPIWYVLDISVPGIWDGKEDIVLTGFWPNGGAISHLEIVGTTPVPEPATMLLVGVGLIGIAGLGRKKFVKKK